MAEKFYRKHNDTGGPFHQPSPVRRFTIEEASAGIGLIQQLRLLGIPALGIIRSKDKVTRVHEILPYIVTHMVGLHKHGTYLQEFMNEAAGFRPDGKQPHDDQVDAMVDGIWECLGKPLSIFDVLVNKNAAKARPYNGPRAIQA
jgi:predicted phage terminase large subunit-like protein